MRWWADEARVEPEVGALGEFRFRPPAGVLHFEVAELVPTERVRWLSRQGPPQWAGTSVTWQLTPAQDGTKLVFIHAGFAQVDQAYEQTSRRAGTGGTSSAASKRTWRPEKALPAYR